MSKKAQAILIADNDEHFRGAVRRYLESEPGIEVRGEAKDGEEAIQLAHSLRPDIVLMNIAMPRVDGLTATERIKAERPHTKVIVVTVHEEEAYRRAANECGADGFLLKQNVEPLLIPMLKFVGP